MYYGDEMDPRWGDDPGDDEDHDPGQPDPRLGSLESRLAHVESYAFKPRHAEVNAPLAVHMAREHPEHYTLWVANETVGDLEDQHYIAHGLLTTEAELLAALAEERGSR